MHNMTSVAIDFDGTLVEDKFPEIGSPISNRIDAVKRLKESGVKVILWTCRAGKTLQDAVEWCREQGIEFDAVNENLPEVQAQWGGDTRKVYCDLYIDDKAYSDQLLDVL